jgi:hypothetical protein
VHSTVIERNEVIGAIAYKEKGSLLTELRGYNRYRLLPRMSNAAQRLGNAETLLT